ncbi:MAG: hypothetical protein A2Y79_12970 [Deltaproteobacteria bacterium RBG_13_43_22]|nr:MAG: hypothetical protein A2Y79_12970 [Deltaproteobacteria bacterium RBG_13_43_22]
MEEWEKAGIVPKDIWLKMGKQRFLCMGVPKEYGGPAADFLYSVIIMEELALINHTGPAVPLHSDVVVPYSTAFGKPVSKFQSNQFKIEEMATEIKLGRTFMDKLITDHLEGENIIAEVSMAKYWITDIAQSAADQCLHLHGD